MGDSQDGGSEEGGSKNWLLCKNWQQVCWEVQEMTQWDNKLTEHGSTKSQMRMVSLVLHGLREGTSRE